MAAEDVLFQTSVEGTKIRLVTPVSIVRSELYVNQTYWLGNWMYEINITKADADIITPVNMGSNKEVFYDLLIFIDSGKSQEMVEQLIDIGLPTVHLTTKVPKQNVAQFSHTCYAPWLETTDILSLNLQLANFIREAGATASLISKNKGLGVNAAAAEMLMVKARIRFKPWLNKQPKKPKA
jgi:hypothetical protein